MKRVMLVSALALGLAGGLCAASPLHTLTVNDGQGERQVLGIFGDYRYVSVQDGENGATKVTILTLPPSFVEQSTTTVTVTPKTGGGYTVTDGTETHETKEVWLFGGTYQGSAESVPASTMRGMSLSGGSFARVFGGGYEETTAEAASGGANGGSFSLTVNGGDFGVVTGGSYNGGAYADVHVVGGTIDVLACGGMADADATAEEMAKWPAPSAGSGPEVKLDQAVGTDNTVTPCTATVGTLYGGGCGGPVTLGHSKLIVKGGTIGAICVSGKEDRAQASRFTTTLELDGGTVNGGVCAFSPDLPSTATLGRMTVKIGDPVFGEGSAVDLRGAVPTEQLSLSRAIASKNSVEVLMDGSVANVKTVDLGTVDGSVYDTASIALRLTEAVSLAGNILNVGKGATLTVPEGKTLTIGKDAVVQLKSGTLVVEAGAALTNEGKLTAGGNGSADAPLSAIVNNGTFSTVEGAATQINQGATLQTNATISGPIDLNANGTLEVTGSLTAEQEDALFANVSGEAEATVSINGAVYVWDTASGDGSWVVAQPIAQIGDVAYSDFASFFAAFQAIAPSETPTTVTLLADLTGERAVPGYVPVKEGQNIVFDLNGHTLETGLQQEGRHYYAIDNYGTLLIKDSSAGQTGTIRARGVKNLGKGKLTIESGTIVSVDANGGACVWNEADVTITGGTFKTEFVGSPSDNVGVGCLNNQGTALVTGGTFNDVNRRTYAIISTGHIEISPAKEGAVEVFGAHGALSVDSGTAVVNGGSYVSSDFYGLYVSNDGLGADPMQAVVTVNDGTFDGKTYSVWIGSDVNDPVNSTIAIKGGTFLKEINRQDVSRADAIQISGGTFSAPVDLDLCADGYIPTAITEGETTTYGVKATEAVAVIANADGTYTECQTLAQAVGFVKANVPTTVTVLRDITNCGYTAITANKDVTIDLNGHDVTFAKNQNGSLTEEDGEPVITGNYPCFNVKPQGRLTLTGTGTVSEYEPIWAPVWVQGSGASDSQYACGVTVGEGVTLKGWSGIAFSPLVKTGTAAYNVSVSLAGTIEANTHGIYVNGKLSNVSGPVPDITVTETGKIVSQGDGIYASGYAKWNLAGSVTAPTALVVRTGELTVTGGTYVSTSTDPFVEVDSDIPGGAVGTGAALSVSTAASGYADTTRIDIQGGTFTSANGPAIYEYASPTTSAPAKESQVVLAISDGTFISGGDYAPLLLTAIQDTHVISGGTFSTAPDTAYLAPGFIFVQNTDGTFGVAEGTYVAEVNGAKFASLDKAIAAAKDGETIVLLADIADQADVYVQAGQTLTLDLSGHTLGLAANCSLNLLYGGTLNLIGSGTVKHMGRYGAIYIYGATKDAPEQICVNIGPNVTVESEGNNAISIADTTGLCYGLVLNVEGTLKGQCGVNISGNIQETEANVPVITLAESSKIVAEGVGIYAAGYAHWTLAGDVTGADALSIKSGTFSITGGDYLATGAFADPAEANGNGSENTGAAVSITTNDGYAKAPIEIAITGGTFTSTNGYAFYEGIAKKGDVPAAEASRAVIEISNGTFKGSATNEAVAFDVAVTTAADKRVISGGVFSKPVPEELCAYGYDPKENGDGTYGVVQNQTMHSVVIRADGTTVECDSMEQAYEQFYANGNTSGTIRLLTDMESGSPINLNSAPNGTGAEMVFDLDGHTMTFKGYAFNVERTANEPPVSLTFADSSEAQTGKVIGTADRIGRMSGGLLTITGGCFIHDSAEGVAANEAFLVTEGFTVAPAPDCSVTFQGSTILVEPSGNEALQALGVQIKGGTFISASGEAAIVLSKDGYASGYWHYDSPIGNVVVSGGTFEGEGQALLIENPTTVTVAGGDFTEATLNIANANATVKVAGGVFEKTAFVGTGTLDVAATVGDLSMATLGALEGKLTLAGNLDIGTNRPTQATVEATAPATVTLDASADELTCGKVPVFAAGDSVEAPANLSLTVGNLLDTQTLAAAETRVEEGKVLLAFTAVPTAFADSAALVAYLQGAGLGSVVALSGTTQGGKAELTAAQMADALAVFQPSADLLAQESAEGGFALSLAYDFGITSVTVSAEGTLTVVAQAQCATGKALAFAEGVSLTLVDAETQVPIAATAQVEGGTVTFSGVALPEGAAALRLQVRVSGPAASDGE